MIIRRPTLFAAIGFAAAAAASVLALSLDRDDQIDAQPVASAPPNDEDNGLPVIRIVRIGNHGDTMIAGRAASGAQVEILDTSGASARSLGRAAADVSGEWVFVPDLPLSEGVWQLIPRSTIADGAPEDGRSPVVIVVPSPPELGILAVALPPGGGGHVLLPVASESSQGPVNVDIVEQEGGGRMVIDGHAMAGSIVHFYVDNRLAGRARAAESGEWRLSAKAPHKGAHSIRADQVNERGMVMARVELGWQAEASQQSASNEPSSQLEVLPSAKSWTIIRHKSNGEDTRTVVYLTDQARIRDPNLLFPGQVTKIP